MTFRRRCDELEEPKVLLVSTLDDGRAGSGAGQSHVVIKDQVVCAGLAEVRAAGAVERDVGGGGVRGEGVAESGARPGDRTAARDVRTGV